MARLSLRILGGFELRAESRSVRLPAKKAQALLAYLAMRPARPHAREGLMALLWGDVSESRARLSLRQTLFRLRQVFASARNAAFVTRSGTGDAGAETSGTTQPSPCASAGAVPGAAFVIVMSST